MSLQWEPEAQDQARYERYCQEVGIPHVCLTCGERSQVSPHSKGYHKFNVLCGACGKHCLPEDEITPLLAGKLLCLRAGAVSIFSDKSGHVWMYQRPNQTP
jgi:hypothetical protein